MSPTPFDSTPSSSDLARMHGQGRIRGRAARKAVVGQLAAVIVAVAPATVGEERNTMRRAWVHGAVRR